jgi:uncharacterized protein YegL
MPKKRPSANPRTLIALIIDESGSMDSRREETITSVNDYLNGIKEENPDTHVTIVNFSSPIGEARTVRFVEKNKRVADTYEIDKTTYRPRGNTPLLDAVGKTIRTIEREDVDRFLVVVVTDGMENDSKKFTQAQIKNIIRDKEDSGNWTFTYLGVGVDAWAGAQFLGYRHRRNVASVTRDNLPYGLGQFRASSINYLASTDSAVADFANEDEFDADKVLTTNS